VVRCVPENGSSGSRRPAPYFAPGLASLFLPLICLAIAIQISTAHEALAAEASAFEIGISAREAGHLRGLVEKLSKQNVLYRLPLGGTTKQQMQETSAEIDRVIGTLEKGSPAYSVAPPPTEDIRKQLYDVDAEWGGLRRMALASQCRCSA